MQSSARRTAPRSRAPSAARLRIIPPRAAPPSSPFQSASESERDDLLHISLSLTSLAVSKSSPRPPTYAARPGIKTFRFLALPAELRREIYGYYFDAFPSVMDCDSNEKRARYRLAIFRTCRTVYIESFAQFFGSHGARIFPTYIRTKKPLLARFTPSQRSALTHLELRLGPGWNHQPPPGWVVNHALGLRSCVSVRKLAVFVECDPSDGFFNGFRRADGFYESFCRDLLACVLRELQDLKNVIVEFDANPSVKRSGAMMRGLLEVTLPFHRRITWGPKRGWKESWSDEDDLGPPGVQRSGMSRANGVGLSA